jgi:hypothetical protein
MWVASFLFPFTENQPNPYRTPAAPSPPPEMASSSSRVRRPPVPAVPMKGRGGLLRSRPRTPRRVRSRLRASACRSRGRSTNRREVNLLYLQANMYKLYLMNNCIATTHYVRGESMAQFADDLSSIFSIIVTVVSV